MIENPYQSAESTVLIGTKRRSLKLTKAFGYFVFAVTIVISEIIANQALSLRSYGHPLGENGPLITNYVACFVSLAAALVGCHFSVRSFLGGRRILGGFFLSMNLLWAFSILALIVNAVANYLYGGTST